METAFYPLLAARLNRPCLIQPKMSHKPLTATLIPMVGHPARSLISAKNARHDDRKGKGVLVNGVFYWAMTLNEVRLWLESRDEGYYGPTQGIYHHWTSGYGGPIVKQMELTLTELVEGE